MSVQTPKAPPLPTEIERTLRSLRLPHIRRAAPEVLATAASQRWDPTEVLRALLAEEERGRAEASVRNRRRRSGLPAGKTFEVWDEDASSIPAATQQALRTLEWIERGEDLCLCGPSGTGKSHFAEALGHLAIALVLIDDVGMVPVTPEGAEALFRLVDAAYEKRSLAITSILHPSGFDELMPPTLAAATVDRLLHHAHVIVTEGSESYRPAQATAGKGVVPLG